MVMQGTEIERKVACRSDCQFTLSPPFKGVRRQGRFVASGKEIPYIPSMIVGRLTAKAQTTIPRAVRLALGLKPGDGLAWEVDGDRAVVMRAEGKPDPFVNDFTTFSEWASTADCEAFDNP